MKDPSIRNDEHDENIINHTKEFIKNECSDKRDSVLTTSSQKDISRGKEITDTIKPISYQSVSSTHIVKRIEDNLSTDDQINVYIQKKFENMKKLKKIEQKDSSSSNQYVDNEHCFQKRKSVIVDNCSPNTSHKCENFEEQVKKVKLDIDIPAITTICRDIFIQEERNYIQNIKYTFETAWDKVSLKYLQYLYLQV